MQKRMLSFISVFVAIAVACSVFFVGLCAQPASAEALDTAKCTARPNADGSNEVKGATETRITWEGQAAADESVKAITLTMPEGTSFSTKNARITMLSGSDLMTRTNIAASFQIQGDSIVATFDEAAPAGGYFRFEVYEVKFPASGGAMDLTGTYELANGDYHDIGQIPTINVVGIDPAEELSTYLGEQDWVQAWNSNKFLHLFLDPTVLVTSFPVVIKGFFMALAIVLVAFPCAIPFGLLLALMRMSKLRILRGLATTYVNVVRGHAAVPADLYRVLRTSACRHPSASLPSWRGGLSDELECLLVRDIPRRYSVDSQGSVRGFALARHERRTDDALRDHPANRSSRDSHYDQRIHPALQGHFAARCRGCHGSGHVREDDRGSHWFDHAVYRCSLLLSRDHLAAR